MRAACAAPFRSAAAAAAAVVEQHLVHPGVSSHGPLLWHAGQYPRMTHVRSLDELQDPAQGGGQTDAWLRLQGQSHFEQLL